MTVVCVNSSMDNFEQQLDSLTAEVDEVMAEAEQLLLDFSNASNHNNSSNAMDNTVPVTSAANNEEEANSDVEEIINEIPVIELLDSTIDMGPRSKFKRNFFLFLILIQNVSPFF